MDRYTKLNYNAILLMMRNRDEISLRDFSKIIDTDYSYLSRIENGYEASDNIYEHAFASFNMSLASVDETLKHSNDNLLRTVHTFCHLDNDECFYDDSMCIDALINNILIDIINNTKGNTIRNNADSYESSIALLDAASQVLNDHQKAVYILAKLYYALLNNKNEDYEKLLLAYKQLSPSKFMEVFYHYIIALKHYFKHEYYMAILALNTVKDEFLNAYLFNWSFIVNYILYKIARSINDETAMSSINDKLVEYSQNESANKELCTLFIESLGL